MKNTIGKIQSVAFWFCTAALSLNAATWTGGGSDDNWSTTNNWSGGIAPAPGDPLVFAGTVRATNVNDTAADTSYSGITFNSGVSQFLLNGNRITLDGNVTNNDGDTQYIDFDMILDATRLFYLNSGSLYVNGVLSGTGGLTTKGNSSKTLVLTGENTYQGLTTVEGCQLRITHSKALGTADNGVDIKDGRRLELYGVTVSNKVAYIAGNGGNYDGVLQAVSGASTWAGPVVLNANASRLGTISSSASLTVTGVIDDGPGSYALAIRSLKDGGPVILTNTNAYDGETQIIVGRLMLDGGDNRLPVQTVVRLGNGSNIDWAKFDLNGYDQLVRGLTRDGPSMPCYVMNSSSSYSTLTVSNTSPYTYKGYINDHINLIKTGSATLTLDNLENNFDGETIVREGTLALGHSLSAGNSVFNTSESAGTLSFTDLTEVNFGGLTGTNNVVLTNELGQSVSLRIRGAQTTVFEGQLLDGVDFTKVGTGTFTMTKPNNFSGKTYLLDGYIYLPDENSLGIYPAGFVQDQITFDGATLKANTNYLFAANNRGVTNAAGGVRFYMGNIDGIMTVEKRLVGVGGVTAGGLGVVKLVSSNSYDGVTTLEQNILWISNDSGLGSTNGETVVENGGQLMLDDGVVITDETLYLSGAGITGSPRPPSSPADNRGGIQAALNSAVEWNGPVKLVSDLPRVGAQNGGNMVINGVISDAGGPVNFRTSSDPNDKTRGVMFTARNTYSGITDMTRGTLFMGATNTLPSATVVNVHWAASNNYEYNALDMNGFDQQVAGLMNGGDSGDNARIVNTGSRPAVLTLVQNIDTSYGGRIQDDVSLVKEGSGSLTLTYVTTHTGSTTVSEGTLALGANNSLSADSPVILNGGILDAGSYTNTLDSLTVTADSTINLGSGELDFVNQDASSWSGQLDLTGTLGETSLRFDPPLTGSQISLIKYDGNSVMQNADGYIQELQGTIILIQ